jgi:hypothetical protein
MEICADMDELRADGRSSPCDILRSLPLYCFELGWRAMGYTPKRCLHPHSQTPGQGFLPWLRQLAPEAVSGLLAASFKLMYTLRGFLVCTRKSIAALFALFIAVAMFKPK